MYYYVEYARAKRALRIALILLGLFLLAVIVLRLSVHDRAHLETVVTDSPTAHVTRTTLADGSLRTVVDDPAKQTHALIVKHPDGSFDMDATQPKSASKDDHHADFTMGSASLTQNVEGNVLHTKMHYVPQIPKYSVGILFLVTVPMGLIVASILGGPLSKENDGHLELAWTKPVSRERYALAAFAVDSLAVISAQLFTIAATLIATLMFFVPKFAYDGALGWQIAIAFAGPLAWYALVTAASASLKRGPGVVIGLGWVAAILIPSFAAALQSAAPINAIAAWFYAIFRGLSYIDPITYLSFTRDHPSLLSYPSSVAALCALVAGYIALAVAQWRRVEA